MGGIGVFAFTLIDRDHRGLFPIARDGTGGPAGVAQVKKLSFSIGI